MSYETILYDVSDRIATITVNRPDKLNALNARVIEELGLAVDVARNSNDVGAIILTGAGRAFIAGADISELEQHNAMRMKEVSQTGSAVFRRFETSPKPTVAAVNGFCLGGGCEIAMACHMRIASESARFGQPETKLGLLPGYGGTQRLPRLVGKGRALQLLMTSEIIDAQEAYRIGLANKVVAPDQLIETTRAMLKTIMANGPLAVAACIEAVNNGYDVTLEEAMTLEATMFGLLAATDDKREGTRAFLEKRAAKFTGA
jgi:enoyl-CoA hydratase